MPGRRLSHDERRLLTFWSNPPQNFPRPLLRQIRIEGDPGLRGIRRLNVPLLYPITAVCGRNGVGKSTVLALAALSARSPNGWRVHWGNTRPRTRPDARLEYAFSDFFHRYPGQPALDGLRIGWVFYDRGNEFELLQQRNRSRWVQVADAGRHPGVRRKPIRELDFCPMSRVLPAVEYGTLRSAFDGGLAPAREPLTGDTLNKLSYIMGRAYDEAEVRILRGLSLPACRAGVSYSGFDMGGGETSVIALLSRLQEMPVGGLLVVEELELGLHAEAQARLVDVLIGYCLARRIQVICTTHSEVILDHLPRQARVLLTRSGGEHEAITNISTRYAIHEMAGNFQPELMIYTEDQFAAVLIEEALPGPVRARVTIRDVGSNTTLARQAIAHLRLAGDLRAISAFDGDCTVNQVEGWLRDEQANRNDLVPDWLLLPADGLTPERWVLRELWRPDYSRELARELNCDSGLIPAHIEAMAVQLDQHDCGFTLSRRTGLDQAEARRRIIRSVARRHPALDILRLRISDLLDR